MSKTLILACGALANEILFLKKVNRLDFDLDCLPAIYHNTPDKIVPALREKIEACRKDYRNILIGYGDCGTGGQLDKMCEELGVQRIEGPHCYSFFMGNIVFEAAWQDQMTSFFLTDFLVDHFENFVVRPLGLDKYPGLRDDYFGHYEYVIYLAQNPTEERKKKAYEAADFLKLSYRYYETGYGDLETFLRALKTSPHP